MKIKALIVDEKVNDRLSPAKMIAATFPDIDVEFAGSADEAWFVLERSRVDLIFVDVEISGKSGWEMLAELREKQYEVLVIIVSAFSSVDYVKKAMRLDVLDYLDKPINPNELELAVNKAIALLEKGKEKELTDIAKTNKNLCFEEKLCINTNKGALYFTPDEVLCFKSNKRYSTLFFIEEGSEVLVLKNLIALEKVLPQEIFKRVSRQYIVNLNYVKFVTKSKEMTLQANDFSMKIDRVFPELVEEFTKE